MTVGIPPSQRVEPMSIEIENKDRLSEIAMRLAECDKTNTGVFAKDSNACAPPIQISEVVDLVAQLRAIIFPNVTRGMPRATSDEVWAQLAVVKTKLKTLIAQIAKSSDDGDVRELDRESIALDYLESLPKIRATLATDIEAAYEGDPACKSTDEVVLCYPGILAVTVYRLAHELYQLNIPLIPRIMTEWAHSETGIDIHPGATIGTHFFIDHGTGVVIGETCKIGNYVKIYQGVTLGALSFAKDGMGNLVRDSKRHPTLEDHVIIYANATVLGGNTTIGHDSVIGSSVWLVQSVEPFTTVTMEKPNLRLRNQSPSDFQPPLDFQI